ncbi:hypothetical protein [Pontibacillus marinus]|uniref:Membrane protein n=1 Tax=Pontibacillus marinus BH030004 = DSM 16465 TaxID=1385511 RepID=A0A0A5I4L8_9BACI|nr:hypothetical protein [Pontibacillus marinus]KGX90772.1 membrane protein [Pontibacillus marinus BH030004 = DSM 16465]
MFNFLLIAHIIGGFSALFLLWVPIFTKKGGTWHTRTGWMFVYAMSLVSISAVGLALIRIFFQTHTSADQVSFSIFLIFIAVLSSMSAYYGIRVLRYKRKSSRHRNSMDLAASSLLFTSGITCLIYGFMIGNGLIQYFPIIGVVLGAAQLAYWLRPMAHKNSWIVEHIAGMMSCAISTVTAFTVFGAPRLFQLGSGNVLLWFLPTIVFIPMIIGFSRKYSLPRKGEGVKSA